jgi:hypothetical protein
MAAVDSLRLFFGMFVRQPSIRCASVLRNPLAPDGLRP